MTAGRVVTPEDVNSMFSHLFELAAASDNLGSQLPFAACSSSGYYADKATFRLYQIDDRSQP